jgi:hypothetical protein
MAFLRLPVYEFMITARCVRRSTAEHWKFECVSHGRIALAAVLFQAILAKQPLHFSRNAL